jgi:hypothetical protein
MCGIQKENLKFPGLTSRTVQNLLNNETMLRNKKLGDDPCRTSIKTLWD